MGVRLAEAAAAIALVLAVAAATQAPPPRRAPMAAVISGSQVNYTLSPAGAGV
jgi:hypothetical protein